MSQAGRGSWIGRTMLVGWIGASLACERSAVDIAQAVRAHDVSTGWYDAGLNARGQNKLVPTIAFRLDNVSDQQIGSLRLRSVFRRQGEEEAWGSAYIRATGREGLPPGATTGPFSLRSELGYTGRQPRRDMLQHGQFVDVTVELFIRHRSGQWISLNQYPIERRLITQ